MFEYKLLHKDRIYRHMVFIPEFETNNIHIFADDISGKSNLSIQISELDMFIEYLQKSKTYLENMKKQCAIDLRK